MKLVLRGSSGSSGSSGRLKVSGGNLVVVTPRPGMFIGTVKKPDGAEQFTYVILFRYGRPKSEAARGHGVQFHCTSDARSASTTDAIELDGQRIEAAYRVELDGAGTSVAAETLTVGGRRVDPAAGRVFLIDLAEDVPPPPTARRPPTSPRSRPTCKPRPTSSAWPTRSAKAWRARGRSSRHSCDELGSRQ